MDQLTRLLNLYKMGYTLFTAFVERVIGGQVSDAEIRQAIARRVVRGPPFLVLRCVGLWYQWSPNC